MSLNDLDFDSSAHFFTKKEKFPWFPEVKAPEASSLPDIDSYLINKALKVPLPLEYRNDLDYLNVPGIIPLARNKSGNNVKKFKVKLLLIFFKGCSKGF